MEDEIDLSVQKSEPYKEKSFFTCFKISLMMMARGGIAQCYIGECFNIGVQDRTKAIPGCQYSTNRHNVPLSIVVVSFVFEYSLFTSRTSIY